MLDKRARKKAKMETPGEESNYARKERYCSKHGVWGFEIPEPKLWRRKLA